MRLVVAVSVAAEAATRVEHATGGAHGRREDFLRLCVPCTHSKTARYAAFASAPPTNAPAKGERPEEPTPTSPRMSARACARGSARTHPVQPTDPKHHDFCIVSGTHWEPLVKIVRMFDILVFIFSYVVHVHLAFRTWDRANGHQVKWADNLKQLRQLQIRPVVEFRVSFLFDLDMGVAVFLSALVRSDASLRLWQPRPSAKYRSALKR